MTDLTRLAKGRACQIRIPGQCSNEHTVVLCHYRMSSLSGLGIKAPNWLGSYGCFACHQIVDGRGGSWVEYPQWYRDLMLAEGIFRTLAILFDEGVIAIPGERERKPKPLSKIVPRKLA